MSRGLRVLALALTLAAGVLIYAWTLRRSELFCDFARTVPKGASGTGTCDPAAVATLRASWWANFHHQPLLAALWILTGATGAYFATELAYVKMRLQPLVRALPKEHGFAYVPKWEDKSFGWRPAGRLIGVMYAGLVTLVFSFVALLYLLRGGGVLIIVIIVGKALGAIFSNGRFLSRAVYTVWRVHSRVINERRRLVRHRLDSAASCDEKGFWASQTQELADAPTLPIFSGVRSVVPVLAGITAILSLIRAIGRL